MIDKLRKKIFWIIQISLSIVLLGVIIIFTSLSYKNTITSSTMVMDRLEGKNVKIKNVESPFSISIEGVYKVRIYNNSVIEQSNDITDEIKKYALEVSKKNSKEGYINNYIFKIRSFESNVLEVTLIENESAIARLKTTIIVAIIAGFAGIIAIFIIAKEIADTIVRPVEETFEKQKQFVSDASHELKTPLAVIEANADVLEDKVGENKWITYIQKEVKSMNKLVNDLLTLAKIGNTNDINIQKFDLSKEVQMSVACFESLIFEKKIKLENNIQENIEFNGDPEDIKHIISILVDNAIKHTNENNKIIVSTKKEKNEIKIEVKNQGDPIAKEDEEKIFERFYRVDKARNRNEKRYGLGLSIAKGLVDKYKGNIKANSKDGFTTFTVIFNSK